MKPTERSTMTSSVDLEFANELVIRMIQALMKEYESTGFLCTPSPERKSQIIDEIAKLRASMDVTVIQK